MSRMGHWYDNTAIESFFATLTKKRADRTRFQTRQEARVTICEYLECFYKPVRLHSTVLLVGPTGAVSGGTGECQLGPSR